MNEKLIEEFKQCEEVEALVLGGSRATGVHDKDSDFDYYVYLKKPFDESRRRSIIDKYVQYMEYSNSFWELEDDGILNNGIDIELIYRSVDDIDKMLENVLVKGNVSNGYTTCFVDNLMKSKVIFDKTGCIADLRNKYTPLLNEDLYKKIIVNNFPLLLDKMPSMFYQVEKAIKRNDNISINHRVTAFIEIYFDILFALNKTTHPGEKRLLEIALLLDKKPNKMKEDLNDLFNMMFRKNEHVLQILESMVINLHQILLSEGYKLSIRSYK